MTKKIVAAAIAAACVVALTARPAQSSDGRRSTLAVSLEPDFTVPVSCPAPESGFALEVDSPAGLPLGTGRTCIGSSHGCDPFVAFCRRTVRATLTLDLARGSLTVPLKLLEVLPTLDSFIQVGTGNVSAGTGIYAAAQGPVAGGGAGSSDEQGAFNGRLVYVAELRGVGR